ncbi:MAG: hypothetical protein ACOY32_07165 [Thermodesulfobacteriota bacterium]
MNDNTSKGLKPEVLISCLDVLCRANASVVENDPKLAADISQAIESLSLALQSSTQGRDDTSKPTVSGQKGQAYARKRQEEIVDVLTNEVIYTKKQQKKP